MPAESSDSQNGYSDRHNFFPTLIEVFQTLDPKLGFNIELKYAMQYKRGDFELPNYFERNLIVDRILECINEHAGTRFILLSSFDPDCCLMLHKKQNRYPVMYLSQGDEAESKWPAYQDVRTRAVDLAIRFAASESLLGVSLPAQEILQNPQYVIRAKELGLVLFSWEISKNVEECVEMLKELNLDGVICDEVNLVRDKTNLASDAGCLFKTEEMRDEALMREDFRNRMRRKFQTTLEAVFANVIESKSQENSKSK